MSQSPPTPKFDLANNSLYVLIGVVGSLCVICGGFAVILLATASSLAGLSVSPRGGRPEPAPIEGPSSTESERVALARGVARGFMDDLMQDNYQSAFEKIGGLLRQPLSSPQEMRQTFRKELKITRITQYTLGTASGGRDRTTFPGQLEVGSTRRPFAITVALEGPNLRIVDFTIE